MKRRGEDGETLAEVLVSTTLLGIIGIGIIGAIASVLISTDIDRRTSQAETILRSYASAITAADYQPCPGADYSSPAGFEPKPNYTASVTAIESWDGAGPAVVTTAPSAGAPSLTFGPCAAGDHGLQKLDLLVVAVGGGGQPTGRATERLTLFKRNVESTSSSAP